MRTYHLVETTTRDHVVHQGLFASPSDPSDTAILWIHGLTSTFYSKPRLHDAFARRCDTAGLGYAAFNNRGHDLITSISRIDRRRRKGRSSIPGGAGQEVFEDSVHDIQAGMDFLRDQGFSRIVVVGHSTGANKSCYHAAMRRHLGLAGVVLVSPTSDRLLPVREREQIALLLPRMQKLVREGRGDELLTDISYMPMTPNRYVSLYTPLSAEDTFDYGDIHPQMTYFSKITKPLLVVFAGSDEYLDRPVADVKKVFDAKARSKTYTSAVIPEALHSYEGKEQKLAKTIIEWVKTI